MQMLFSLVVLLLLGCSGKSEPSQKEHISEDPYAWLEEIDSERSLDWVSAQNAKTKDRLESRPEFEQLHKRLLSILNSKERIPYVGKAGEYCYNFWRDDEHIRGVLRRASLEEYKKESPVWEMVLDLDALANEENENWAWQGGCFLQPTYERALFFFSRGGTDARVVREFDLEKKAFVSNGFYLPEAKSHVAWKDKDTLYVGTDFGSGSLTQSGYPRVIKEWSRNTPLTDATTVFEGNQSDMMVTASSYYDHGHKYELISQYLTFFTNTTYLHHQNQWVSIDKPADVNMQTFGDHFLFLPQSDWTIEGATYPAGALLAIEGEKYLQGDRSFHLLFQPTERSSLAGTSSTKHFLILNILENVQNKVTLCKWENSQWTQQALDVPLFGSTKIQGIDPDESDAYFLYHSDYLTPSSLSVGDGATKNWQKIKQLPTYFCSENFEIQQYETISKDGTRIPYFQVSPKRMRLDGKNPTLLYGYGGFQISLEAAYDPTLGAGWLEQGGVYVEANIRGGGEFGPQWHQAARKENRQRAFDDFIAVAEDLIARGVTSSQHLGIQGGSNGGLLMGVMLTQRPELWKAVVCQVPLLDMLRYHKLLAGASWIDEYGDPEQEAERAFLQTYSPYHNVHKQVKYPEVLFTTSTRDDRVHPGHARKMAAKMEALGLDVTYYENMEGGHAGALNHEQAAYKQALEYTFLSRKLRPSADAAVCKN